MNIIDALRLARERRGISGTELGRIAGVGNGQIRRWESGDEVPGFLGLEKWTAALGLRLTVVPDSARKSPPARMCGSCECRPVSPPRTRFCSKRCARTAAAERASAIYLRKKAQS
ncbi:helix-turn-helix transcriptional regulator [Phytomonospora sp. NPDC050363]|uniref:helix-turn-helix domain-containing protein n=1 Tax=Phytomonospora sp. NPDC050363 TaxID=3155642 RepID=UPI0033CD1961